MPNREDDRMIPDETDDIMRILDAQTNRPRPESVNSETERDEQPRRPAIQFQFYLAGPLSSRQR